MRFIVASDGHYGQPNTDFKTFHTDLIGWVNREKLQKGVDFLFFNGDLIHEDRTEGSRINPWKEGKESRLSASDFPDERSSHTRFDLQGDVF